MVLFLQVLALVVAGIVLLWFGFTIFFGRLSPFFSGGFSRKNKRKKGDEDKGVPGNPQVCPVCSTKLTKGEQVKTIAFPAAAGSIDRLMHIRGCYNCMNNNVPRRCPVCGIALDIDDYLISRMFERTNRKNHIHVLGCNHCRKTGRSAR